MSSNQNQTHHAPADHSYKARLDQAADKARYPNQDVVQNKPGIVGQVVEKVTQYVPGAQSILGGASNSNSNSNNATEQKKANEGIPDSSVPPVRPHHDVQIEEFVRAQHGSKLEDMKAADSTPGSS